MARLVPVAPVEAMRPLPWRGQFAVQAHVLFEVELPEKTSGNPEEIVDGARARRRRPRRPEPRCTHRGDRFRASGPSGSRTHAAIRSRGRGDRRRGYASARFPVKIRTVRAFGREGLARQIHQSSMQRALRRGGRREDRDTARSPTKIGPLAYAAAALHASCCAPAAWWPKGPGTARLGAQTRLCYRRSRRRSARHRIGV